MGQDSLGDRRAVQRHDYALQLGLYRNATFLATSDYEQWARDGMENLVRHTAHHPTAHPRSTVGTNEHQSIGHLMGDLDYVVYRIFGSFM